MSNELTYNYYRRQLSLSGFGENAQRKLNDTKILVVGAGGLASSALQYLAGAGIGKIGIVDGDIISEHNLHRQTIYDFSSIGKKKVEVAKEKLQAINPYISIESYDIFLQSDNANSIIKKYDLVVDCTDNFEVRYLINDFCVLLDKAFVYGAIYRFQGQVSVFNLNNGPTYRCVFPETKENERVLNCNEEGVLGTLPGIIGTYQAIEVIKIIAEIGEVLNGKMLIVDILNNKFQTIAIQRKETDYKSQTIKNSIKLNCTACEDKSLQQVDPKTILQMDDFIFLDVRDKEELPKLNFENVVEIPLSELENKLNYLPIDKQIICVCKSGKRSEKALKILQSSFKNDRLFNLRDGLSEEFIRIWKRN